MEYNTNIIDNFYNNSNNNVNDNIDFGNNNFYIVT